MAEKLELVRGYDFQADQGTVSLLGYTDGFQVAYDGWTPKTKIEKDGRVREALTLRVEGTATDDIAVHLQALAQKERECAQYFDDAAERYAVWFRVQLDGESNVRQSLVYKLAHELASSVYTRAMRESHHLNEYRLGIERAPWWEAVEAGTLVFGTAAVSSVGGTVGYAAIGGDLPARIAYLYLNGDDVLKNPDVWVGFRSNRYGTASAFDPYCNIVASVAGGGTAVVDAAAKDGTATVWGPHAAQNRVCIASAAPLDGNPRFGEYLVLLRAKIDGTNAGAAVQMQSAFRNDYYGSGTATIYNNGRVYPRVQLEYNGTALYRFYEMGVVNMQPTRGAADVNFYTDALRLVFYSQTTAGTPTLSLDGCYLIPTEAMVKLIHEVSSDYEALSGDNDLNAHQSPDGLTSAYSVDIGGAMMVAPTPTVIGGIPPGDSGVMVVCAQGDYRSELSYVLLDPQVKYFERWQEMRGDD